jgi:uncharacterized protein YhaN
MSTLQDVLKAVRDVVVMNERVTDLAKQVERLAEQQSELDKRVVRIEAFIDIVKPAVTRRLTGPG